MIRQQAKTRSLVVVSAAVCLALVAAACGDRSAAVSAAVANRIDLPSGFSLRITPGAVRERRAERPLVWTAAPTGRVRVRSDDRDPPQTGFRFGNLGPNADLIPMEVQYLSASDQTGCDRETTRTVNCLMENDPLCMPPPFDISPELSTRATFQIDLEACVQITFNLTASFSQTDPLRVVIIGRTDNPAPIRNVIENADAEEADIVLLTGDHLDDSKLERLEFLTSELESLPAPIVVTPGEREHFDGSLAAFRQRFGPGDLTWEIGDIQFVAFRSARQTLGEDGVVELRTRLRALDNNRPVVALTHTPPRDPSGLRDRGFRSRIEGSRTLSVLSEEGVDLLIAGHIEGAERASYDGLSLFLPPGGTQEITTVTLEPGSEEGALDFGVDLPPDN